MKVPAGIFREYDVRGLVGDEITPDFARGLGRALGTVVRRDTPRPTVAVGFDNRPSSGDLCDAVCDGLVAAGCDVRRVGLVPTPALYFTDHVLGTDAAMEITASHNPAEYNGFKMVRGGRAVYGEQIRELRHLMEEEEFVSDGGEVREVEILERYVDAVAERAEITGPVKVVVDCGNGTGSVIAVRALEAAGAQVVPLFCESDGTFPNHHPDPTVDANLVDLVARVRETGADLGVGLDGDADRIGAVTGEGQVVRGDHLVLLFALDVLRRHPGAPVIFDVKCTQALPEMIRDAGGEPIMWRTGHSLIKEKMRETGAPLAGEMSGHIFFADDYFGYDDAIYAAARLAALVAARGESLAELVARIPSYPSTPELRLECDDVRKFEVVREAVEDFRATHDVVDIDGARIQFDGGWALIRASNTQPVIVVRFEAESPKRLQEIRDEIAAYLGARGIEVPELDATSG